MTRPDLVPVVDIGGWEADAAGSGARSPITAAARSRIADEVDDAGRRVGFLQIAGHGVPAAVIEGMLDASDAIFSLPLDAKLALGSPPEINRGYAPLGSESLTYSLGVDSPPDLFEAFNIGPDEVPTDDPVYGSQLDGVFAPNVWPESLPDGRRALVDYFGHVAALARRLTSIFAVALGLDEDFFVSRTDHSTDTLRLNHYVRAPGGRLEPGQVRMGAHTDYGIVTVLYGDRVPGLEIVGPDGEWHGVVPDEGLFLVNLGDLLAQWTNDRWRSTVHRVVPPAADAGPSRRRSAAFFHDGNYDALVECLPTCVGPGQVAKYPPVVAGDHLLAKVVSARRRSTASLGQARDTLGDRAGAVAGTRRGDAAD